MESMEEDRRIEFKEEKVGHLRLLGNVELIGDSPTPERRGIAFSTPERGNGVLLRRFLVGVLDPSVVDGSDGHGQAALDGAEFRGG